MKKVAMFSGGKDSSATIIIMHELGITPDLVVFSEVMFDNSRGISGELPEHLDFIYGTAKPLYRKARFESKSSTKMVKKQRAGTVHTIFGYSRRRAEQNCVNGKKL